MPLLVRVRSDSSAAQWHRCCPRTSWPPGVVGVFHRRKTCGVASMAAFVGGASLAQTLVKMTLLPHDTMSHYDVLGGSQSVLTTVLQAATVHCYTCSCSPLVAVPLAVAPSFAKSYDKLRVHRCLPIKVGLHKDRYICTSGIRAEPISYVECCLGSETC